VTNSPRRAKSVDPSYPVCTKTGSRQEKATFVKGKSGNGDAIGTAETVGIGEAVETGEAICDGDGDGETCATRVPAP
jgi:hypothetical protein